MSICRLIDSSQYYIQNQCKLRWCSHLSRKTQYHPLFWRNTQTQSSIYWTSSITNFCSRHVLTAYCSAWNVPPVFNCMASFALCDRTTDSRNCFWFTSVALTGVVEYPRCSDQMGPWVSECTNWKAPFCAKSTRRAGPWANGSTQW